MSQFYTQLDARNKPAKIARKLTDDDDAMQWLLLTVPSAWDIDFSANFDAYVVNPDDLTLTPPGNTDTPTLDSLKKTLEATNDELANYKQANDELQTSVDSAKETIANQSDQLAQYGTLLPQLQQMVVQSTQAQAQNVAGQDQLKTMMVQMSQTLAVIQANLPATEK